MSLILKKFNKSTTFVKRLRTEKYEQDFVHYLYKAVGAASEYGDVFIIKEPVVVKYTPVELISILTHRQLLIHFYV